MGFASAYLENRVLFPEIAREAPEKQTGIIVVVPSYNEPDICLLLDSLAACSKPDCETEVIVVVNAPADATSESLENNELTCKNIESWKKKHTDCFFRLFVFFAGQPSINGWGVGLARKTGMDEAVRRFNSVNNPEGVILNLDADCQVEKNYFVAVCDELLKKRDRTACSIYFEHPISGHDFPEMTYKYITFYELHLRFFFQALSYSGFPYVFHTVGSSMAVKAMPYILAGGMNRRQAGEDFYFIQKLVSGGGYFSLNSTTVYPSPRESSRVPFGTGATIGKLTEDASNTFFTYNLLAFNELRYLFGMTETLYNCENEGLPELFGLLPVGLKLFLNEEEWIGKMMEIKNNTAGLQSFTKRFFGWFNLFRIVKYLNYVHLETFTKNPVDVSALALLEASGVNFDAEDPLDLLLYYRSLEKNE